MAIEFSFAITGINYVLKYNTIEKYFDQMNEALVNKRDFKKIIKKHSRILQTL